jgi:hypothetical protein
VDLYIHSPIRLHGQLLPIYGNVIITLNSLEDLREIEWNGMDWIDLAQDRDS